MAKNNLNNIFLSASIPNENRDRKYFDTTDVIAIRDSVRALATVVIPNSRLIWGGHPAITPLIHYIMKNMNLNIKDHIKLYQSNYFKQYFPKENEFFEDVRIIKENKDKDSSLEDMRNEMINNNDFVAGIFIGGMEGVEIEYNLFKKAHPYSILLPIASTGAAAKIIYDRIKPKPNERLINDYAYMSLFRDLLGKYIYNFKNLI
ncbi:MAG TPA: hypothetical protein VIL99_16860 [Ignavibacteria bacterium]